MSHNIIHYIDGISSIIPDYPFENCYQIRQRYQTMVGYIHDAQEEIKRYEYILSSPGAHKRSVLRHSTKMHAFFATRIERIPAVLQKLERLYFERGGTGTLLTALGVLAIAALSVLTLKPRHEA